MDKYGIPLTADEVAIDMKSIVVTKQNANVYEFVGLSKDKSLLPKYRAIGTGSMAFLVDTSTLLMYEATSKTWYEV